MKKTYIPPVISVHVIASMGALLQASNRFDGYKETPQVIDFLDDEIISEDDIG